MGDGEMPRERIQHAKTSADEPSRVLLISWGKDTASLQVATSTDPDGFSGEWVDLTRASANQAINLLRRARDAAFGKDA